MRLSRISGLDPAGPLFASDVPYPFNWLNISHEARLNRGDADFVDVIHTDGKARYLCTHFCSPTFQIVFNQTECVKLRPEGYQILALEH